MTMVNIQLEQTNCIGRHIVRSGREQLGDVEIFARNRWSFFARSDDMQFSSADLRAIADKLDELNGETK